jgi:putative flippase GtrA
MPLDHGVPVPLETQPYVQAGTAALRPLGIFGRGVAGRRETDGQSEIHGEAPSPPSRWARFLCFAFTGGIAAVVQLAILDGLTDLRWGPFPADFLALLISTQVNFALSYVLTWRDRRPRRNTVRIVLQRWAAYQASASAAALLNLAVFLVGQTDLHLLVASALGTASAAGLNFVAGDRLVFRVPRVVPRRRVSSDQPESAA